jgi:thiol-disulfide isomerase/thioredoxin
MVNKRLDAKLLISALIITTLIFIGGVFTGATISRQKLGTLEERMLEITRNVQNFQLQFMFIDVLGENATCPLLASTLADLNEDSYEMGLRLTNYDPANEMESLEDYTTLKKEYSRTLIGYWLLSKKLGQSCEQNASTIVYFYSKNCKDCDSQGFVLDYMKKKYGDNIMIFALDADLDEPSLQAIKKHYSVTEYPSLIVDGQLYNGLINRDKLEEIIVSISK